MFLKTKKVKMPYSIFPTRWQTFLFRNYGFVETKTLANVLRCDEETVQKEVERMGLQRAVFDSDWLKKGYITLIRNNWYLLPYSQLNELLGTTQEQLDFILEKDDFLSVKLGDFKPECEEVFYQPLSQEQIQETKALAKAIEKLPLTREMKAFDFFSDLEETTDVQMQTLEQGARIIHGYLTPCGNTFAEESERYLPDVLLEYYQKRGINGLWFHGVLSELSPSPLSEENKGYELRRNNLQTTVERCAKYGIGVYLYLNEPRGIPVSKIGKYADVFGRTENGVACYCFEKPLAKEYLYTAVKSLCEGVKGLRGLITITMSENPTHCHFRPNNDCPYCKHLPPQNVAADVNNVIAKAARDSGSGVEVIANLWGWSAFMGWTEEQTLSGVELLSKDVSVLCVSEYDLEIVKGGVKSKIIDYSLANVGPSEITKKTLKKARETGHKIYAKIQVNNSWECSATPELPAYDLLEKHLKNLREIGVENYMLSWTLGGFPSLSLDLVGACNETFDLNAWYGVHFGKQAEGVREAVSLFCQGFEEYPFSIDALYFSPKTLGSANLWDLAREENKSTMCCFAFDDYENWILPYDYQTYTSQMEKLLHLWQKSLKKLRALKGDGKVKRMAFCIQTAYLHLESDYLQTQFSYYKRRNDKKEIIKILKREEKTAKRLLDCVLKDARVGFETSNHYFYTERNLIEKIICVRQLLKRMKI